MSNSSDNATLNNEIIITNESASSSNNINFQYEQDQNETWKIDCHSDKPLLRQWKKPSETMSVVQHFINEGLTPKEVLAHILPNYPILKDTTDEFAIQIILELFSEKRTREKLPNFNTFHQAVDLFRTSKNIIVLTGAGVSVSCGIPDFRSSNGIYARLHKDFPELPDPTAMFDVEFFRKNPAPFYNFAKEIFPGQFKPSVSHMFIKFLEESGKLLRNYTQNIDTLEKIAGIDRVVECHGSFSHSTCLNCKIEVDSLEIKEDVFAQRVAYCKNCKTGVMKPNIIFFGENLDDKFHNQVSKDYTKVDLLVVIGSSLKVQPVALIPFNIDPNVPQILINREQLQNYKADIKLLGNCDNIIIDLCMAIGGDFQTKMLKELETRQEQFSTYTSLLKFQSENLVSFYPKIFTINDFKKMIDEPPTKRKKLALLTVEDLHAKDLNTNKSDSENSISNISNKTDEVLWESNYVSVSDILPFNSLLFISPNLNTFKGVELYYNRDNDTFCNHPDFSFNYLNDDDEFRRDYLSNSSIDNELESNDSQIDKANSIPPDLKFNVIDIDNNDFYLNEDEYIKKRSESCPPNY